jgi:chromosome segregation ATPase
MEKKAREREVISLREQVRAVESQRAWQSSETAERDRSMSELRERAAASELKASELELRLQQVSLETKAIAAQRDVLDKRVRRNDELATGKNFELEQLRKRLAAAERGLSVSQNEVTALKSEKGKGALKPPLPVPNVPNKQEVRPWGFPKSRPPCVPILVPEGTVITSADCPG